MRIALQGEQASFHDMATRQFFSENVDILPCETFTKTIEQLEKDKTDYAVAAIGSSFYGSVMKFRSLTSKRRTSIRTK